MYNTYKYRFTTHAFCKIRGCNVLVVHHSLSLSFFFFSFFFITLTQSLTTLSYVQCCQEVFRQRRFLMFGLRCSRLEGKRWLWRGKCWLRALMCFKYMYTEQTKHFYMQSLGFVWTQEDNVTDVATWPQYELFETRLKVNTSNSRVWGGKHYNFHLVRMTTSQTVHKDGHRFSSYGKVNSWTLCLHSGDKRMWLVSSDVSIAPGKYTCQSSNLLNTDGSETPTDPKKVYFLVHLSIFGWCAP